MGQQPDTMVHHTLQEGQGRVGRLPGTGSSWAGAPVPTTSLLKCGVPLPLLISRKGVALQSQPEATNQKVFIPPFSFARASPQKAQPVGQPFPLGGIQVPEKAQSARGLSP